MSKQRYKVLVGINYPPGNKRAEVGEVIDDLTPASIAALTAPNPVCVEPTNDPLFRISPPIEGLTGPTLRPVAETAPAPVEEV